MSERPNVVFIVADQLRADCVGVERGQHPVVTPHLNQLAAEGASFGQAYADCPLCMPQRATMLTGQYASRFGRPHNFMDEGRTPIELSDSLPYRLVRDAGYQTKAVGKMHFEPPRARYGFEHVTLHPDDYVNFLEEQGYGGLYRGHGLGGNEVYPAVSAVPERYTHTHWITDESIMFLSQRDPDHPFFLWMIFEAPHSPFDPPEPYDRMYDSFAIPEPATGDWIGGEDDPIRLQMMRWEHNADQISAEVLKEVRRRYYGQVSHIDYQLGRFLGELKQQGLYDDTLIVFTSDHGEHLGDHGLFAKTTFLQSAARVPLIVKPPSSVALAAPGRRIDAPVLTADIPASILDLAGLDARETSDGVSLVPALTDDANTERIIFGETLHSAFATDGRHKFIYYPEGGYEQLFDVVTDPDDLHNLVRRDDLQPARERLKQALIDHLARFDRPFVSDGELIVRDISPDERETRARNIAAWRGPLRYGDGY